MAYRLPPLNALRAFEAAARHLSFSRAAEELHVTPGAISHQIKALEDYLGVALFRRMTRAVELTEAAQACLPKLREGFECLVEAIERTRVDEARGALSVSVPPAFGAKWLLPRLHRFTEVHPQTELRLSTSLGLIDALRPEASASMGVLYVRPDEADLTIRFGRGEYPGFRADKLFSVSVTPMCSPALLKGKRPLRRPADLRYHTLLHEDTVYLDEKQSDWAVWLKAAGVEDADATRGPHFSNAALAIEAAADGLGIALSVPALAEAELASGRLVMPFALRLPSSFAYFLVGAEASAERARIATFRNWLLEEARSSEVASGYAEPTRLHDSMT